MLKKMKMTMKKASASLYSAFALIVLMVLPTLLMAQTGFDTADGSPPDDEPTDVPVNGGVMLLLVLAVAYGAYRLYRMNQMKNSLITSK